MSDLTSAVAAVTNHLPAYVEANNFYVGDVDEVHVSPLIGRVVGDSGRKFNVNLAGRVVNSVLDRMKIASVMVPKDEVATAKLIEIWDKNRLGMTAKTLHRTALSQGDGYMFLWGDPDDDSSVEIHFRSPKTTRVFYDEENPHQKKYASFVWRIAGDTPDDIRIRVNLLYADRIERYISKKGMKGDEDSHYEAFLAEDQEDWLIPNPWNEVTVFHFRTDEPYGRPVHKDAFGPQNAINKLVAVHMGTVDYQGFAQRYRLRADKIVDGAPADYPEDGEESLVGSDEDSLQSGPGTVWDLSDTKSVGEFKVADPDVFLKPINAYARMMGASTATPMRFLEPTGEPPSGESLRADDAPLAEKIGDLQTWLGEEWRAMLVTALRMCGVEVEAVKVDWRPVQIIDYLTGWQTVQAKIAAGVPQAVALQEAGYRPAEVEGWAEGSDKTNLDSKVDMLVKIGAAMQSLGTAVTLGVVDQATVDRIVSQLLDDASGDEQAA